MQQAATKGPLLTLGAIVICVSMSQIGANAADTSVEGRRLVIVDGGPEGASKVIYVAKGDSFTKGSGTDAGAISARIDISRGSSNGGFTIPAGAALQNGDGWRENSAAAARYSNRAAATGIPTGVRSLVFKAGSKLRVTTRSIGDDPIDIVSMSAASVGIRVITTISNDGETNRHCTIFPAADISTSGPSPSGRTKLVARRGQAAPCPGILLAPTPTLPTAPNAPSLYFNGSDPAALAALSARITDPATQAYFNSFRATVDNALGSLGSASDDTLARVAKASALLHFLEQVPPAPSGFTQYSEVTVTALLGIKDRTALDSVDEFLNPPPNLLNVLQDSGRLQSMAEAYDLLRGTTIDPADDSAIRDLIANWALAFVEDWNLIGDPFGVFAGHRDNWAVKAGSALVTASLALPAHPSAPTWLSFGITHLNESLYEVVMGPGWYSEGPHYVNYSLNNLASTAWHVRHAAGADWFDDLAPLVETALALRQPDGESAPFEEGVANVFPYDVLAAAYPALAPQMLWAWDESSKDPVNYDNQQIHSVTRFLVVDTATSPAAPTAAPTSFLAGDTNAVVLRSSWDADAVQLTSITALDHSAAEVFESRHNTENPLDVTFYGAGAMLLPTASGGPQVTSSANRAVYLEPSSKNIPLVDANAPYLLDPFAIAQSEFLDSRDAGGIANRLLDTATTKITEFAPGVTVERTVGLVADRYGIILDHFESTATHDYGATWRGRGDAAVRIIDTNHLGVDYAWPTSVSPSAHLSVDVTSATPLTGGLGSGLYAPAWGVEEALQPLDVAASSTDASLLALLRPRTDANAASTVEVLTAIGGAAAFRVVDGSSEHVIASRGGQAFSVDGISSDAMLAIVERQSGTTTGLAFVRGTSIEENGQIETNRPVTLSLSLDSGAAAIVVGSKQGQTLRITLSDLPGLDAGAAHSAELDGTPLSGNSFVQSGTKFTIRIATGGVISITPTP